MISSDKRHAMLWCAEPIENIENYDKALADKSQLWVCHHRLELHPDGSLRFTRDSLKKLGLYEHRPASELIFMPYNVHSSMHNKADKEAHTFLGEHNPMYGQHHTEETRKKISVAKKGKTVLRKNSQWVTKYGMTRRVIEEKLNLTRKQVEKLNRENKLKEAL